MAAEAEVIEGLVEIAEKAGKRNVEKPKNRPYT